MSMGHLQAMQSMLRLAELEQRGARIVFVDPKSDWPEGLTFGKLGEGIQKEVTKVAVASRRNEPSY